MGMLTNIFGKACRKVDDTAVKHRLQDKVHGFNSCLQTELLSALRATFLCSTRNLLAITNRGGHPEGTLAEFNSRTGRHRCC